MRGGDQAAQTAGANRGLINYSVDAPLINTGSKNSKELTDRPESAHQTVPEMTIHPVDKPRAHPAERDDRATIKFVDPHFVFEESKQCRLREFERISVGRTLSILRASVAIHPATDSDANAYQDQRKKERWLNQAGELEVCSVAS